MKPGRIWLFATAGVLAFAQPPGFEVSTIKLVDTLERVGDPGVRVYPGGRLVLHALS